ncbi:type VI secretion system membrane subunit TssM, partial [Enterobacter sp. CGMCC 5087]
LAAVLWVIILVAVWWGGPLFTFHDVKPFASLLSRGLFALGWLWLACIVMLWRVWRNMHNARQEQRLQESRQKDPLQAFVDGQQRFLDGWAQALKALPGQGSVYGKPWYMMIGLPGSGKSSLLHRACPPNKLHARLHNELRSLKEGQKVDCWLGEGAVIVDPYGDLLLQTGGETENKDEQHS